MFGDPSNKLYQLDNSNPFEDIGVGVPKVLPLVLLAADRLPELL